MVRTFQRVDDWVGQAVRGELDPSMARTLRWSLAVLCLAGAATAMLRPASATTCLIFLFCSLASLKGRWWEWL